MPTVTPPGEPPVLRAEVVTGEAAEAITTLAVLLARTPEELAIEHAAGNFPIPDGPNNLDWSLFDSGELTTQERSTPPRGRSESSPLPGRPDQGGGRGHGQAAGMTGHQDFGAMPA